MAVSIMKVGARNSHQGHLRHGCLVLGCKTHPLQGLWLDLVILVVFSNLHDFMIP